MRQWGPGQCGGAWGVLCGMSTSDTRCPGSLGVTRVAAVWAPPQQHLSCCPHVLHGGNLRAATAGPERAHVADAAVSSSRPLTLEKSKLCLFLLQKNINATSCF